MQIKDEKTIFHEFPYGILLRHRHCFHGTWLFKIDNTEQNMIENLNRAT